MIRAAVFCLLLSACSDPRTCLESRVETVATYPYMGMMAMGSAYLALALTPVYVEQEVCTKWEGQ